MIYAMTVALGFAALKTWNTWCVLGQGCWLHRSLLSIPIHLACAAIWGYGLARARFISKHKRYFTTALPYLLAAAGVHAAFDFFIFLRTWTIFLVFPLLLFIVWYSNRKLHYLRDQSLFINGNYLPTLSKIQYSPGKILYKLWLAVRCGWGILPNLSLTVRSGCRTMLISVLNAAINSLRLNQERNNLEVKRGQALRWFLSAFQAKTVLFI